MTKYICIAITNRKKVKPIFFFFFWDSNLIKQNITWELFIMNSYVRTKAIIQDYSGQIICHVNKKKKAMVWIVILKSLIEWIIIYR